MPRAAVPWPWEGDLDGPAFRLAGAELWFKIAQLKLEEKSSNDSTAPPVRAKRYLRVSVAYK